jgi:hypothetical protein
MKTVIRLLKVASKQASLDLRQKAPLPCPSLASDVLITKAYFNHIAFSKKRELKDLAKRLGMTPLIPEILKQGVLEKSGEKEGRKYYRIIHKKSGLILVAIVVLHGSGPTLLSSFTK